MTGETDRARRRSSKYRPDTPATVGERARKIEVFAPSSGVIVGVPRGRGVRELGVDNPGVEAVGGDPGPFETAGEHVSERDVGELRERVGTPGMVLALPREGSPRRSGPDPGGHWMRR